jgi:hypothetical protein
VQRSHHITGHTCNHKSKARAMKLPKPLLVAMLSGITLQAVESCTKKKDDPKKEQEEKEKDKDKKPKPPYPYSCIACGMG